VSIGDLVPMPGAGQIELDRTPPQDILAEQCALGGMLLSKDAIADVVEVVKPADFYRPAHQVVYDAIIELYGKGEPADPVTVAAELTRSGSLERIGGAPYLHTLIASVPTAANAGYYAEIIRERAILRRLIEAGTKVVQLGYGAAGGMGGDVDDVVDRAQQAVYEVVERRTSEDYIGLEAAMWATYNEIEAIGNRGGELFGVPTGFRDLDDLTNGLHDGQLVVVAGRPGLGKALALDTRLATPTGWTTMGEVAVGDHLIGADGRPTRVVATTEVMVDRPCYEVHFDDGSVIVADEQHQWLTQTRKSRRAAQIAGLPHGAASAVRTTAEIAATLRCQTADRRLNHAVALTEPLALPDAKLLIRPYTFGVWLGEERSPRGGRLSSDTEIEMYVEAEGHTPRGVVSLLRPIGVGEDKHIPASYLRSSDRQRRALLAGLLDAAASVTSSGAIEYETTCPRLATDVRELVHGLGYRTALTQRSTGAYSLSFSTEDDVFNLERKRIAHKERRRPIRSTASTRFITEVRKIESVPVRCVQVDNADHMYLAGESMIPTHNSTLAMDFLRSASIGHEQASVLFSLEMGKSEITMRLLSAEARIPLTRIRTGSLNDDDWNKLARRMGEVAAAPMFIDDSPNLTMMEIRAKARRLKQRHDLKLVVVDYLQLMSSPKRVENRQQEVAEMSRSLKLLAKELAVPVVAVSQLNRGAEQRSDKRPQLSDLRESGAIEQDADMVILLHREDAYERESPRAGEADLIVAKHRNGPTKDVVVSSQLHYSRFVDMPHS
jgi:replicative DNA helicase